MPCKPTYGHPCFSLVPVVSTTFASVERNVRKNFRQSRWGGCLIDEAGQAGPAKPAVGALMRTRAGPSWWVNPMQLETGGHPAEHPHGDDLPALRRRSRQVQCTPWLSVQNG